MIPTLISDEQRQAAKKTIKEIIDNECYDFCDVYDWTALYRIARCIVNQLARGNNDFCVYFEVFEGSPLIYPDSPSNGSLIEDDNWDLCFKVHNGLATFISCSDSDSTGVSKCLTNLWDGKEFQEWNIKNIVDMVNESWYLMQE